MAPEHLRAFNPEDATTVDAVSSQADHLLTRLGPLSDARRPAGIQHARSPPGRSANFSKSRRAAPRARPQCREGAPSSVKMLERTISRCLAPNRRSRFASGAQFAEQLDGCRRIRSIERQMPPLPKFAASAARRPLTWLLALHVLPQVVASVVNYLYNFTQVVHTEVSDYHGLYVNIAIVYNSITYVTVISLIVIVLRPIWRCWQALESSGPVSDEQVAIARQKVLRLPIWFATITACGWYIGGLILPPIIYFTLPRSEKPFGRLHARPLRMRIDCTRLFHVRRIVRHSASVLSGNVARRAQLHKHRTRRAGADEDLAQCRSVSGRCNPARRRRLLRRSRIQRRGRRRAANCVSMSDDRSHCHGPHRLLHRKHDDPAAIQADRNHDEARHEANRRRNF